MFCTYENGGFTYVRPKLACVHTSRSAHRHRKQIWSGGGGGGVLTTPKAAIKHQASWILGGSEGIPPPPPPQNFF